MATTKNMPDTTAGDASIDIGVVVGATLGGFLFVAVVIGLACSFIRHRRENRKVPNSSKRNSADPSNPPKADENHVSGSPKHPYTEYLDRLRETHRKGDAEDITVLPLNTPKGSYQEYQENLRTSYRGVPLNETINGRIRRKSTDSTEEQSGVEADKEIVANGSLGEAYADYEERLMWATHRSDHVSNLAPAFPPIYEDSLEDMDSIVGSFQEARVASPLATAM